MLKQAGRTVVFFAACFEQALDLSDAGFIRWAVERNVRSAVNEHMRLRAVQVFTA